MERLACDILEKFLGSTQFSSVELPIRIRHRQEAERVSEASKSVTRWSDQRTILAICWRKSLAPPDAGWRTQCALTPIACNCAAAIFPSATICSQGNNSRKAFSTGRPESCFDLLGIRLLNKPRCGSNECHGNAFHKTNSSGSTPIFNNAPQTIVAVGSEKPSGQISGLLVRRGLIPAIIFSGGLPGTP